MVFNNVIRTNPLVEEKRFPSTKTKKKALCQLPRDTLDGCAPYAHIFQPTDINLKMWGRSGVQSRSRLV